MNKMGSLPRDWAFVQGFRRAGNGLYRRHWLDFVMHDPMATSECHCPRRIMPTPYRIDAKRRGED